MPITNYINVEKGIPEITGQYLDTALGYVRSPNGNGGSSDVLVDRFIAKVPSALIRSRGGNPSVMGAVWLNITHENVYQVVDFISTQLTLREEILNYISTKSPYCLLAALFFDTSILNRAWDKKVIGKEELGVHSYLTTLEESINNLHCLPFAYLKEQPTKGELRAFLYGVDCAKSGSKDLDDNPFEEETIENVFFLNGYYSSFRRRTEQTHNEIMKYVIK